MLPAIDHQINHPLNLLLDHPIDHLDCHHLSLLISPVVVQQDSPAEDPLLGPVLNLLHIPRISRQTNQAVNQLLFQAFNQVPIQADSPQLNLPFNRFPFLPLLQPLSPALSHHLSQVSSQVTLLVLDHPVNLRGHQPLNPAIFPLLSLLLLLQCSPVLVPLFSHPLLLQSSLLMNHQRPLAAFPLVLLVSSPRQSQQLPLHPFRALCHPHLLHLRLVPLLPYNPVAIPRQGLVRVLPLNLLFIPLLYHL